jgi:hypothetical protein
MLLGLRPPRQVREPVPVQSQHRRNRVPIDPILAHQYGWDEVLLFVVPIAIAVVVVRRLDKRSRSEDNETKEN